MTLPLPPAFLGLPLAHRGLHDRAAGVIENSRAAVAAAVEAGYGVEIDLQLSADGEAMVFHDWTLDRVTAETGRVAARTARELSRIELTDGGEGIPTLAEILDIVRGRAPLVIELKDQSETLAAIDGRLERRVTRLIAAYDGPVALMSFHPDSVALCRDLAPATPRGRVTRDFHNAPWPFMTRQMADRLARVDDLEALGAGFISHEYGHLEAPIIARKRGAGLPVLCWTIKSPEDAAIAARHADNITFEGFRP